MKWIEQAKRLACGTAIRPPAPDLGYFHQLAAQELSKADNNLGNILGALK